MPTVQEMTVEGGLRIRVHLIITVGSRHILVWNMDSEGNLPCFVGGYKVGGR